MLLKKYYLGESEPTIVSERATMDEVVSLIQAMDWDRFCFVTLAEDDDNWIDGSGSLSPDDGLSVMLSMDQLQYVTVSAPKRPTDFIPLFDSYLNKNHHRLFAQIFDVEHRSLTPEQLEEMRREDDQPQRKRLLTQVLATSSDLFKSKHYAEYIHKLTPYESMLSPVDAKKLELARRRISENDR